MFAGVALARFAGQGEIPSFLLTDLLPGDVTVDPLGHLLGKLTTGHRLLADVARLRGLLADADRYCPGDPVRLGKLRDARNLADQISLCERPLTADVAADAHIVLPAALAGEAAGTALGRFTGLLHVAGQDCDDAGLAAEVVARPRVLEGAALAPPTGLAPQRIPVGVPVEPGDVLLDDLLLVSDGHRLILWSSSQDRQVIPVLYSRLTSHLLPPLARFLQLVGRTGRHPLHGWSWEPAGGGPFTPRIRYRRTILAPARWVMPPTLTRTTHDRATWPDALTRWRTETVPAPPDLIVVDDGNRCLPLDLRRADDRELLRRYAGRGVATVTELPGGPGAIQAVLPGLAALADDLAGHYDTWFWLRYHTPEHGPHIRARFRGDPATLGSRVLPAFSAWCREMIRHRLSGGFTVEPYDQEIERYGGPIARRH